MIEKEIIKILLYFDIFNFPLLQDEIQSFCMLQTDEQTILTALDSMIEKGLIYKKNKYYQISQAHHLVDLRENNHKISLQKMKTARAHARIIFRFPFVRGVAISGSLSKYFSDEYSDIDFFIITHSNRLWISRTLLHVFKKITFLVGKQHDFCMNHFLDENELELKDKNLYTAVESTTILPVFGAEYFDQFLQKNNWINQWFPNKNGVFYKEHPISNDEKLILKKILETLFDGRIGNSLNPILMRLSFNWWKIKFKLFSRPLKHFNQDFRSTTGESKFHENDHQRRILKAYQEKLEVYFNAKGEDKRY